jgi:hypothetical protein
MTLFANLTAADFKRLTTLIQRKERLCREVPQAPISLTLA